MHVIATQTAPQDIDGKTFAAVKEAVLSGAEVRRDLRTGHIVPAHLQGRMYSPRDLLASALAEDEARLTAWLTRKAAPVDPLKLAAE